MGTLVEVSWSKMNSFVRAITFRQRACACAHGTAAPPSFVFLEMSAAEPQPEGPNGGKAAADAAADGAGAAAASKKKRTSMKELGRQVSCIPAHTLWLRTAATPPRLSSVYIARAEVNETERNEPMARS